MRESLGKVEANIQDMEKERIGAYEGLKEQCRSLSDLQAQLRTETGNLVKARRVPAVRGRWGEIQLKRVVEMAGMLENCDFEEQPSVDTEEGRRRPDMIIRLPAGKRIIIDAKVPLSAYLEAIEATDEDTARERLKEHARQLRGHMKKLAAKSYWQQFEFTPEFVVIFLPGEIFYNAALQCDPTLIESGVSDNIVIATPMILIALFKAIAYGWRQDSIARSAAEISNLGRELYKRLGTMGKHFTQLRKSLESTVDCFNQTAGALESRVLPGARRFRDMGAVSEGEDLPTVTAIDRTPKALLNVELFGGIDGYRAAQADGGQSAENNGPGSR